MNSKIDSDQWLSEFVQKHFRYEVAFDSGAESEDGGDSDVGHKDLITAHFPTTKSSDLYFFEMVDEVRAHNQRALKWSQDGLQNFALGSLQAAPRMKGLKVDFKHMSAVKTCVEYLSRIPEEELPHLWLNADILVGPAGINLVNPLDPEKFLTLCAKYCPNAVLSLGWTHGIPGSKTRYSQQMIDDMISIWFKLNVFQPVIKLLGINEYY